MTTFSLKTFDFYDLSWFEPKDLLETLIAYGNSLLSSITVGQIAQIDGYKDTLDGITPSLLQNSIPSNVLTINYAWNPNKYEYAAAIRADNVVATITSSDSAQPIQGILISFCVRIPSDRRGTITLSGGTVNNTNIVAINDTSPLTYFVLDSPVQTIKLTFNCENNTNTSCIVSITCCNTATMADELIFFQDWLNLVNRELTSWTNDRAALITKTLNNDSTDFFKSIFNTNIKYINIRGLQSTTSPTTMINYRNFLESKMSDPSGYGIHPFYVNINFSLRFYIRGRASYVQGYTREITDIGPIPPPPGTYYVIHTLTLMELASFLEVAMHDNDVTYITTWLDWICIWLHYPYFPHDPDEVDDKEQELVNDLITHFKYMSTLYNFYPTLWEAIPTEILFQINYRLVSLYLPAYLSYMRTDSEDWRYDVAPMILSYAYLLEEFNTFDSLFARALEEIEIANLYMVLPDGFQVQADPWYHFMYFSHATCLDLFQARRTVYDYLSDNELIVLNSGIYDKLIIDTIARVTNFLSRLIQYNGQYPCGFRDTAKNTLYTMYNTSGLMTGPANYAWNLTNFSNENLTESYVFPYAGMYFTKTSNSYGLLYNSPYPTSSGAYRGRRCNNLFTLSIGGVDYFNSSEAQKYFTVSTPVNVIVDKILYVQDFNVNQPIDPNYAVAHKGYRSNAWKPGKVKYYLSDTVDRFDSIYFSTWVPADSLTDGFIPIRTWHRRRVSHHKKESIWIIIDEVEGDGQQMFWLNSKATQVGSGVSLPNDYLLTSIGSTDPTGPSLTLNTYQILTTNFTKKLITLFRPSGTPDVFLDELLHEFESFEFSHPPPAPPVLDISSLFPIVCSTNTGGSTAPSIQGNKWIDYYFEQQTSSTGYTYHAETYNLKPKTVYHIKLPEKYSNMVIWDDELKIRVNGSILLLHINGFSGSFLTTSSGVTTVQVFNLTNDSYVYQPEEVVTR